MSENENEITTQETTQPETAENGNEGNKITSLEDAMAELKRVRAEAAAKRIKNKELEEKAKRWEEYEESQKTELQKLQDELAKRDEKLTTYQLKEMKQSLIDEYELDKEDLDLLTGSDEESNRVIAERLKAKNEKIKNATQTTSRPADLLAGNRGTPVGSTADTNNFDNFLRSLAKR